MNLLQVTNTYFPELQFGGPPLKIHALSKGLAQRGHQVRVVTFDSKQRACRDQRTLEGIPVQYLPWIGYGLRQWPTDRALLATAIRQADIVHCYGLYNFLCPAAIALAHKLHRPALIEPMGMYRPRASSQFAKCLYHRLITRRMFQRAACVVATSPSELEELHGTVDSSKLGLRRNGIDVAACRQLPSKEVFCQRFKLAPADRLVLFVGRISPIKNLEQLIRAFDRAALANVKLVLAGPESEPPYAAKLRELIQSLNLADRILWTGPLFDADKLAALAAADLFVLPSLSESFGNAAAEAVAAGVPVLLTDTCGIAPLIHRRAGLAVPLGEESLANGLRLLLDDAVQRAALTRHREAVLQELSWEEPLNEMERIYGTLLHPSTPDH